MAYVSAMRWTSGIFALLVLVSGCGSPGAERVASGQAVAVSTTESPSLGSSTTRPSSASTQPEPVSASLDVAAARRLLSQARGLPIPPRVRDCVAAAVVRSEEASAELVEVAAERKRPNRVLSLADTCMRDQVLLPSLVDGIDARVKGDLTERQRDCLTAGFEEAGSKALDDAINEALTGGKTKGDSTKLAAVTEACGVELGR